jgi:hypothetical protein
MLLDSNGVDCCDEEFQACTARCALALSAFKRSCWGGTCVCHGWHHCYSGSICRQKCGPKYSNCIRRHQIGNPPSIILLCWLLPW